MGRRCRNWDYRCDAVYLITLVLADRSRPVLGQLVIDEPKGLARGRRSATGDGRTIRRDWQYVSLEETDAPAGAVFAQ